jgi:hypothetical protein
VLDLAGKAMRWQPFGEGTGIEEGTVQPLGRRFQNPV